MPTTSERRYQVFVSSTYTDLREARAEVMQALLELDCMPAGMELFPAANDDQWNWIKRVIDESDYYIVVLAGRYGSVSSRTGLSYTEMEYHYALEIGKPVIGFVHEDPNLLPAKSCESDPKLRKKLSAFRELVLSRLCKRWSHSADLGAKVSRSLTQLIRQHPAVGWVHANSLSPENAKEVLSLRRQVEELQLKLQQVSATGPAGVESLSQGGELFAAGFTLNRNFAKTGKAGQLYWVKGEQHDSHVEMTWDHIFACLAPLMIEPAEEHFLVGELNRAITALAIPTLEDQFPGERFVEIRIFKTAYETIKIQLRALGLIASVGDGMWSLTDHGDVYMTKLLAVQRSAAAKKQSQALAKRTMKA